MSPDKQKRRTIRKQKKMQRQPKTRVQKMVDILDELVHVEKQLQVREHDGGRRASE